jgi:hypothetical protein
MTKIRPALLGLMVLVLSCGSPPVSPPLASMTKAPPGPTASDAASASPTDAPPTPVLGSATALALRRVPADLACDAITVGYHAVTIRIDPATADPVTAVADTGTTLLTYWAAVFRSGPSEVLGPDGVVVARDGDTIEIPAHGWPLLAGFTVCPSPRAIYVLDDKP